MKGKKKIAGYITVDKETAVIALLSGYAADLVAGKPYLETTYKHAAKIVKVFETKNKHHVKVN